MSETQIWLPILVSVAAVFGCCFKVKTNKKDGANVEKAIADKAATDPEKKKEGGGETDQDKVSKNGKETNKDKDKKDDKKKKEDKPNNASKDRKKKLHSNLNVSFKMSEKVTAKDKKGNEKNEGAVSKKKEDEASSPWTDTDPRVTRLKKELFKGMKHRKMKCIGTDKELDAKYEKIRAEKRAKERKMGIFRDDDDAPDRKDDFGPRTPKGLQEQGETGEKDEKKRRRQERRKGRQENKQHSDGTLTMSPTQTQEPQTGSTQGQTLGGAPATSEEPKKTQSATTTAEAKKRSRESTNSQKAPSTKETQNAPSARASSRRSAKDASGKDAGISF